MCIPQSVRSPFLNEGVVLKRYFIVPVNISNSMKKVKVYAEYIAIWVLRTVLSIFNLFPIRKNRVMFYSFNGKQYSCNPRCISDALLNDDDLEIYWAFKDPDKFSGSLPEKIRTVRFRSLRYYFLAKTSRVIVCNVQQYGELARRKGQDIIQTWHASNGYKKVGNYTGFTRKLNLMGHRDYSYVLSGAESMTERRVRGTMKFFGPVLPGTPRMDVLVNRKDDWIIDKVKKELGCPAQTQLLLYAPTWRGSRESGKYPLSYEELYATLKERFPGEWMIAVRYHPNVKDRVISSLPYVVDATDYPDMQELLYTADALISDYSSCIWDYSFTYRPCFLFCYDLKEYYAEKSFDLPIEEWGFPICVTMEELDDAIRSYDADVNRQAMNKHHEAMGSLEDGHATERVCTLIRSLTGHAKKVEHEKV